MADSNGTANGMAVLDGATKPMKLRRPSRTYARLVTARGSTTSGKPYPLAANTIVPPPDYDVDWRVERLDTHAIENWTPSRLLEVLSNLSPEMSKGLWDYMRLLNPGWSYEVYSPGSDTPNARARVIIDTILDRIKQEHGSVDVALGRLHMGAYMRGGYFGEAVFDDAGREMIDLATPDPASVRFRVVKDDQGRSRYQLGQWQDYKFIPLDEEEGVSYIPVDPFPGSPYGRPLVAPAMFSALFLLGLLHDLRRVISQQGWPRIHIKVLTEKLLEGLRQDEEVNTPEDIERKLEAAVMAVKDEYSRLQPDDAYITGDEVEIGGPIGVTGAANLAGVEGVIEVVERMLVRALKTMPLVLGITDGVSEANANRQWEILVSGVKAMQHLAESMLERFFELACRMQGVQANVVWEFAEIRASERQRDALAYSQEIDNQVKLLGQHFIDREEASMDLVGHPPALTDEEVAELAPDVTPNEDDPETDVQDSDENPEEGSNNAAVSWRSAPVAILSRYSDSRAVCRAEKFLEGFGYAEKVSPLQKDDLGVLRLSGENGDGESFRLWEIGRVNGEDVLGRYDIYFRDERPASAVPTASHRPPVGGGSDDRGGGHVGRQPRTSHLESRYARLRRPTRRHGRLTSP